MGLRLLHVSSVVLVCVVLLLRDNLVVDAVSESYGFLNINPECSMSYWSKSSTPNSCISPYKMVFKENAIGPVFSFNTKFVATINLGPPDKSQLGYGGSVVNGLEGFTFALLPHPNASVGGDGGYLGLLNATSNGDRNSHTFAVEFDFVKSPQFSDPDAGFHIGININSMVSSHWVSLQESSDFKGVWTLQVWIDYDASSQILNVNTADISGRDCPLSNKDRPPGPSLVWYNGTWIPSDSLSVQVDLSTVLNEYMYVGFTSSIAVAQFVPPSTQWHPELDVYRWILQTSSSPISNFLQFSCYPKTNIFIVRLSAILVLLTAMAVIYALLYK